MASGGPIKRKELASSVSPEANRSKKPNQESDVCVLCKTNINDDKECSIQCQWCNLWVHSKCSKLEDEECKVLSKSNINLIFLCTTCAPNLDEALEYFDDNRSKPAVQLLNDSIPDKQSPIENRIASVETQLLEFKKELSDQLSKCREMFNSQNDSAPKPPALIASTVTTAFNEERDRERRQLNLIIHNLPESNASEGEARKTADINHVTDIFKFLGAKANVTKAIRLGKKCNKPRLLKISVDTLESKIFILRNSTNIRKANPSSPFAKVYITPDLTPAERETNNQLRLKLKDMNKGGNQYKIKNGRIVRRRD